MNKYKKVFQHFKGIDQVRESKRQEFQAINDPEQYRSGYIGEKKYELEQEIIEDRKRRGKKALEEIEKIEKELTTRTFKNPYHEADKQVITTEDKLLIEMQQARQADILKAKLRLANKRDDFLSLVEEYGEYEYYFDLIILELQSREGAEAESALLEINKEPEELTELRRLKHTVITLSNSDYHPEGLDAESYEGFSFEQLKFKPLLDIETVRI